MYCVYIIHSNNVSLHITASHAQLFVIQPKMRIKPWLQDDPWRTADV